MSWRYLSFAIGAVVLVSAQNDPRAADGLVIPGVRVGPVTRTSTEASLIELLGRDATRQDVDSGEGNTEPGLVIYPGDPARRLEIVWNHDIPARPWYVSICRSGLNAPPPPCRWRTAEGVGMGTTLNELERLNRRPFTMVRWGTDAGGNVVSFDGGALASFGGGFEPEQWNSARLLLRLEPRTDERGNNIRKLTNEEETQVYGSDNILPSSHPVLQKMNPYVAEFTEIFPRGDIK